MNKYIVFIIIMMVLCFSSCPLAATLNVPETYATVQLAMNEAQPGDTVSINSGTYDETVVSVRDGTSASKITVDGKNVSTIKQFVFLHRYITLQNMTLKGSTLSATYDQKGHVLFMRGADYGTVDKCIIDVNSVVNITGVQWREPTTKPFGSDAASYCTVQNSEIKNVVGAGAVKIFGDYNTITNNYIHDLYEGDYFYVWGRYNTISRNRCWNNRPTESSGNHPDFIQTFGDEGYGSSYITIDGNYVGGISADGMQICQLSGDLIPEITNWTFRNNIFTNINDKGSITIPNVAFYNNLFYKIRSSGGHILLFSCRYHDPATYTGTTGYNCANNGKVYNNIFINNGRPEEADEGWYQFYRDGDEGIAQGVTGGEADYNYVAKDNWGAVTQNAVHDMVGEAGYQIDQWWEDHGVNGGNLYLTRLSSTCDLIDCNFTPTTRSTLIIGTGKDLSASWSSATDYLNVSRPVGTTWDIGPYEFGYGMIFAWGRNVSSEINCGQIGDGSYTNRGTPVRVGTGTNWASISAGYLHSHGLKSDGTLWAWGCKNIGLSPDVPTNIPTQVGVVSTYAKIAAKNDTSHQVHTTGNLTGWGSNVYGQVGDAGSETRLTPVSVSATGDWEGLGRTYYHTFAIKSDGTIWGWGSNEYGELGDNNKPINTNTPSQIGTSAWKSITGGPQYTIAIKSDGTLWAWGHNDSGEFGNGTKVDQIVPTQIGTDSDWSIVSGGFDHVLALKTNGRLYGWGGNGYGQVGNSDDGGDETSPVLIGTSVWKAVSSGMYFSLGVKMDGTLWAWGYNPYGQLGDGTTTNRNAPVQIGTDTTWIDVSGGGWHSLGLKLQDSTTIKRTLFRP